MTDYLNLIFLIIHFVHVQSEDANSNYFDRKPLTTTNRTRSLLTSLSIPAKTKPSLSYRYSFDEQFYFQVRTESPIAVMHRTPLYKEILSWYELSRAITNAENKRELSMRNDKRRFKRFNQSTASPQSGYIIFVIIVCICTCISISICGKQPHTDQNSNPAINNNSAIELIQVSTQPVALPHLITDTSRNSREPLETDNSNITIAEVTSVETPPPYDDSEQQNSIATSLEQWNLSLPTYAEFIRKNY